MTGIRILPVGLGVFLISLSVLVYEIALTRILSIILTYHYVFLVVSGALLGLSSGAIFDFFWRRRTVRLRWPEPPLSLWGELCALSMSASIFLIVQLGSTDMLLLLILGALPPFFFAGAMLAAVFRRFAERCALVYTADLAGAGVGAVAVVWMLNRVGGPASILAAAVIAAVGALCLARELWEKRWWKPRASAVFAVVVAVFAGVLSGAITVEVPVGRDLNKDLYRTLNNPSDDVEIVDTRWSAFGRTDLVRQRGNEDSMDLFVDGAAGTPMFRWSGDPADSTGAVPMLSHHFTGAFPLRFLDETQRDRALVIGPGGGRDVLVCLLAGIKEITAVEVNPDFVAMVRKYSKYNGGIYSGLKNVRIVVDEGRNFLKRSSDRYDVIMLTLPITKSSRSYEGYALTENFLFTRESFRDYLSHLTPEGSLIVVGHGPAESLKLLTTALSAFADLGKSVPEAMRQIYVLGDRMMPVFVVQNTAMDSTRANLLHTELHIAGFDGQESYVPYAKQVVVREWKYGDIEAEWWMMDQNMIDLAKGEIRLDDLVRAMPVDITPTSDDRPFFYKFEPGVPGTLSAIFWVSGLFLAAAIGIPALRKRRYERLERGRDSWQIPLVFTGIGVGFMLIEIALFQKLVLYLGQPTFALSLLLFSLLLGTGLGSMASGRMHPEAFIRVVRKSALLVTLAVLLTSGLLDMIFERLISMGTLPAFAAAFLLIMLGIPMGFPFPLTIRYMKKMHLEEDIPWMWGVNGAASVFGSVLAVVIAVSFGYSASFMIGGLTYLSVAVVIQNSKQEEREAADNHKTEEKEVA